MKKYLLVVVVAIAAITLAACGKKNIRIGVVMPDAREERWQQQDGKFIAEAIEALGEEYTYEILYSEGDEAKEKANVEALIARGAEVIILTAQGSGAGAVQAARAAGVTLIAHDRMAKSATELANYYTTFNSWEVGRAQGKHLVDMAKAAKTAGRGDKFDLAIYAGRVADWPNATYFFGGAMEEIHGNLDLFNIVTVNKSAVETLLAGEKITEANFTQAKGTELQKAMNQVDTDWYPEKAKSLAEATVAALTPTSKDVFVLAPNDDTSAAIRLVFAGMTTKYENYYTTGQDASNVALASLMGDPVKGQGTQTMTVFKNTRALSNDSVKIAHNVLEGKAGLTGLTGGPKVDGVDTAYTPIDTLLASTPKVTYDLIFKTGFKNEADATFSNIDFSKYK